jgi:hypothetical protein
MRRRVILASIAYLGMMWVFGGRWGLAAGVAVVMARWLGLPRQGLWALSVTLLIGAPIALIAQGLPGTPVVGAQFGTDHLVAHILVGLALALAAFALLSEMAEGEGPRIERGPTRRIDSGGSG